MKHSILITDEGYSGLNPVQFGYQNCAPQYSFGPAVRDFYILHFVVSGYGKYQIGDKEYTLRPGEMFVIRPFDETYYEADSEHPWSYIWIGFRSSSPLPLSLPNTVSCPDALSIFQQMKKCADLEQGRSAYLCARLWDLFSLLLGKEVQAPDYLESALAFIHAEYMNAITVDEIAKRLNLDRTYFSTLFKKKIGASPKQYLIRYRMSIAASLMTEKKKSVSVAAYSVGYPDIFNFSKMFKRCYGMSPNEYIKSKKKSDRFD